MTLGRCPLKIFCSRRTPPRRSIPGLLKLFYVSWLFDLLIARSRGLGDRVWVLGEGFWLKCWVRVEVLVHLVDRVKVLGLGLGVGLFGGQGLG